MIEAHGLPGAGACGPPRAEVVVEDRLAHLGQALRYVCVTTHLVGLRLEAMLAGKRFALVEGQFAPIVGIKSGQVVRSSSTASTLSLEVRDVIAGPRTSSRGDKVIDSAL